MDKLAGTCIVLLLHHADMGVNSKAFHTSLTGHTTQITQHIWEAPVDYAGSSQFVHLCPTPQFVHLCPTPVVSNNICTTFCSFPSS